jgi:purine-binding chemotaxis protein CheW
LADAAALARAFDQTFAEAPLTATEPTEELLGVGVGGGAYFLRLRDVRGLTSRPKVVSLPSPLPELVGVMGLRGAVIPVYALGPLLGHPSSVEEPAWVLLVGEAGAPVGLGVREFTGHVRVPRRDIAAAPVSRVGRLVRETARLGQQSRGVVDVGAVVASLWERVRPPGGNKER